MTGADGRVPDPRMIPSWWEPGVRSDAGSAAPETGDDAGTAPEDIADATLVRPFFVTGGRTRPLRDGLRIHTMLTAPPSALQAPLRFEQRQIVELCQVPCSVAEVASRLRIPIGVTRVIVADLANDGYLTCHDQDEDELPLDVIERIRDRVRAL